MKDKSILDIFDTILKTSAPDKLPTSHFLLIIVLIIIIPSFTIAKPRGWLVRESK